MIERPLVLLVEDEAMMRRILGAALQHQGYAVTEAETGAQALARLKSRVPDVVLLDLGLPDIDGVELVRRMRKLHSVPILVVSACAEEQQQIRALDAGANDYVVKPFREGELMARVRVALRKDTRAGDTRIELGALAIEPAERRVLLRGVEVELTPTEFSLLNRLAREPGRVVTHHQLLEDVWGPSHAEDVQYLRVYMKQIRQKVEDDPARPKRLLTALGVGYRLVRA